ncbi:MAG: HAD family phosphatase [Deltaproteobacteria bacterium]|nr:HAD family phosphatase [Deltaproteobacteria bacterium]
MPAVLFDFNGVLVDDEELHFEAFRAALAERGVVLGRERYYAELLGFDDAGLLEAVLPGVAPRELEEIASRKAAEYARRSASEPRPFDGVLGLVRALYAASVPMAVVSGALGHEVRSALGRFGIADCFRCIVASEDVDRCKPDPAGYLEALRRLGDLVRSAAECVAIEDSPAGIAAAKAAGMRAIGVAHTVPREQLAQADLVAASVADLDVRAVLAVLGEG